MTVLLLLDVYTELVIDVFYIFNSSHRQLVILFLCSSITEPHSRNTYYLLTDVFVWSDLRISNQHA